MNTTQTRKMDTTKINWTVMGAVIEAAEVATLTSNSPKKQCWLNCLHKAAEVLSSNAYWYWEDELLVIVSQSKKHIYTVTRKGHHEGCEAYSNGKPCYHRALRKLLELYERADITQEEGAQAASAPVETSEPATTKELAHLISSQSPATGAMLADYFVEDGSRELPFPPPYHRFQVNGHEYCWYFSSHKIRGKSMAATNQLIVNGPGLPKGSVAISIGRSQFSRKHISQAINEIRKAQIALRETEIAAEEHERLFEQAEELVRRNCRCSQDEGGIAHRCDWCQVKEEAQQEQKAKAEAYDRAWCRHCRAELRRDEYNIYACPCGTGQVRLAGQPSPFKSHAPAIRQSPLKAYYDTETRKLEQALRAEDAAGVGTNLRKLSGLEAANAAVLVPVTQQGEKYGRFDI